MTLPDQDLIVEIPSDTIQLGHDADGLPRTDPKELPKDKDGAPDIAFKEKLTTEQEAEKKAEADLVAALKRDKEAAIAARDAAVAQARTEVEAERNARAKAEGESKADKTVAMRAHWTTLHERKQNFEGGLRSSQDMIGALKRDIKQASADGDHDRLADLNEQMAEAVNAKNTYEHAGRALALEIEDTRRKFEAAHTEAPAVEKKDPPTEPKYRTPEDWIDGEAKSFVGDDGAKWLKEHRELILDGAKNQQLISFCRYYASKHGQSSLKSQAFRNALDAEFFPEEVEMADDEAPEVEVPKSTPKPKAKATAAAPVSRGNSFFSSNNLDAGKVRLPPKLAAFVRASGLDPTKYALGAVEDIKAGKLPKNFLDADYPHEF